MYSPDPKQLILDINKYCEQQNYQAALSLCNEHAEKYPKNSTLYMLKSSILEALGRVEEATSTIDELINHDPSRDSAYYLKSKLLLKQGEDEKAMAALVKVAELNPQYANCYHDMGTILSKQSKYLEAIEMIDKAIKLFPTQPYFYMDKGICLAKLGQKLEAIKNFDQAIAMHVIEPLFYYHKGKVLIDSGRQAEALKVFDRSLETLCSGSPLVLSARAKLYQELGKHAQAEHDIEQIKEILPKYHVGETGYGIPQQYMDYINQTIEQISSAQSESDFAITETSNVNVQVTGNS